MAASIELTQEKRTLLDVFQVVDHVTDANPDSLRDILVIRGPQGELGERYDRVATLAELTSLPLNRLVNFKAAYDFTSTIIGQYIRVLNPPLAWQHDNEVYLGTDGSIEFDVPSVGDMRFTTSQTPFSAEDATLTIPAGDPTRFVEIKTGNLAGTYGVKTFLNSSQVLLFKPAGIQEVDEPNLDWNFVKPTLDQDYKIVAKIGTDTVVVEQSKPFPRAVTGLNFRVVDTDKTTVLATDLSGNAETQRSDPSEAIEFRDRIYISTFESLSAALNHVSSIKAHINQLAKDAVDDEDDFSGDSPVTTTFPTSS